MTNTYWRLVRLDGEPVHAVEGRREPHLLLKKDGPRAARATVGCNQLTGGYTVAGETLTFTDPASTRMACPPPLDALERSLGEMLVKTRSWRIKGPTLELSDESGATLALLEAVFF